MKSALALGAVAATASATSTTTEFGVNPITRIAGLLQGLADKVEEDGKAESKLFMKYKCWYKSTVAEKTQSNSDAAARIEELTTFIADIESGAIEFTSDRVDREKELAAVIATMEKAKDVREQENADFLAAKDEMDKAITALDKAVTTMKEGTKDSFLAKKSHVSHVDMASLLSQRFDERRALQLAKSQMTSADFRFLEHALSEQPAGGKDWNKLNKGAKYDKKYEKRSGEIQDILAKMLQTFKDNLEDAQTKEDNAKDAYDSLMETKQTEKEAAQDALRDLKGENAAKGMNLADAKAEKEALETQVKNDNKFIGEVETAYEAKLTLFKQRKGVRADEVAAISEAIGILRSDDARDTMKKSFASQGYFFVQTGSESKNMKMQRALAQVYKSYKKAGASQQQLAAVMTKLQVSRDEAAADSSIKEVIDEIDKMLTTLETEAEDDLEWRTTCETDTDENQKEAAKQAREIDSQLAIIDRKEARVAEYTEKIAKANATIADLEAQFFEANRTRHDEHAEYLANKADDETAKGLIEDAITALKKFYVTKIDSFVQTDAEGKKIRKVAAPGEAPAPPPPTFEGEYGGEKDEGEGVVGILVLIKEDVEKDLSEAKAEDDKSEADFKDFTTNNEEAIQTQNDLIKGEGGYSSVISDAKDATADAHGEKDTATTALDAAMGTLKSFKGDCDFIAVNFGLRDSNRKTEMDGLKKAKSILSGGAP